MRAEDVDAFRLAGDFLERQEAVAVFAVVDEARFERRLDTGDDTFVDIAFALFAPGCLDVDVDELLPIDDGDAQLSCCVALNSMRFMNDSRRLCWRRLAVVSREGGNDGRPHLVVLSRARWSGNDGGRIA